MNTEVNIFLDKAKKWQAEMRLLRNIIIDSCNLTEEYKWMKPCYTLNGKNIVLIHSFKDYCALLFHKGVLLNDAANILIQQTENVQSARQIRFKSIAEIEAHKPTIKAYILEAIELEKNGVEVKMKSTTEFEMPKELITKFKMDSNFEKKFNALTPGRQRGYLLHFAQPKQSKTRESRIEKSISKILLGKGLTDR